MLRIPRRVPFLLAVLLKQPCCTVSTGIGSWPSDSLGTSTTEVGLTSGRGSCIAWSNMAPKRGHWQRKKEERRFSAKRGREGGWGTYGSQAEAATATSLGVGTKAAAAAVNEIAGKGNAKPRSKNMRKGKDQTRRTEAMHAGSYAGELGATLSEGRRQLLHDRFEQDAKKAAEEKEEKVAAPYSAERASASVARDSPGVGHIGKVGAASSSSKKKVALVISYWGSDYQGLQMNAGAKTIEAELELALYLAGIISKDNFGNPRKIGWSRAGRTDKGVHAVAQVIAAKLTYPNGGEKEMVEAINSYLPEDIRAMDIKRAPKGFDSKNRCSGRRYEYVMPTYVLAPKEHVAALFEEALKWERSQGGGVGITADKAEAVIGDISSVAGDSIAVDVTQLAGGTQSTSAGVASAVGGTAVVEESSEAAAAISTATPAAAVETSHTTADTSTASVEAEGRQEHPEVAQREGDSFGAIIGRGDDDDGDDGWESDSDDSGQEQVDEEMEARLRQAVELSSPAVIRRVAEKLKGYRLPPDRVEELRETLNGFLGTKNYHNYTNHKKPADPSCKRLITSFTAADPFENDGVEWVRLTVGGQSFMMHQIRKMVASTVDRVRGQSEKEDFTRSFSAVKISLGIAPSEGLYLERPLYTPYNSHAKRTGARDRVLEWETGPVAENLEKFKNNIQAGIFAKEKVDCDFVAWLDRITRYPCTY